MRHLVIVVLWSFTAIAQAQPVTAITGATLVNPGEPPVENATIVIRGERIVAAGPGASVRIPRGATRIDADGKWVIPGLIDGHVHFFQSGGLYTRPDIYRSDDMPYEQEHAAVRAGLDAAFARYLRSGITTVVDVGGPMWNFEVRDAARVSDKAPRVAAAGPLISSYEPEAFAHLADKPIIRVTDPEVARRMVREQAAADADFIKVWYIVGQGRTVEDFLPVYTATVEEAGRHGIPVAVHATELETARAAVQHGADILVHGVFDEPVDEAFVALLRERDVIYVPTIAVIGGYARTFSQQHDFLPEEFELADPYIMGTLFDLMRTGQIRRSPFPPPTTALVNLKAVHGAGVTVAAGTDAGNIGTLPGPSLFREFQAMADAGLAPAEILKTATVNGARLAGRADDLGTVAAGKLADLVILDADPLVDIRNTAKIHRVVANGTLFTPDDLVPFRLEDLIQRQLNAYNARHLEDFLATYSDDIQIYTHPDTLTLEGKTAMAERYGQMFRNLENLHATITQRMVRGNVVVDYEQVRGFPGADLLEVIAIYEVEDRLIRRVWFIR